MMDKVFKALADPTRRSLLDALFREDGQSLTSLQEQLPISRFGVAKHLRQLEDAGLVVVRREGREKRHYLNPVPIRQAYERWVTKFAERWAGALTNLKDKLEKEIMKKVFEIYIRTTPERLWDAITDPDMRRKYNFGVVVESELRPGGKYRGMGRGNPIFEGEILELEPRQRLVQSYNALWSDEVRAAGTSRVTWEIEKIEDSCKLTVTHDDLPADANPQLYGGWPMILSGLKTLLETGETLTTPGSLMWLDKETLAD